jgi:tetratricopeptide (TPR) repeat protein
MSSRITTLEGLLAQSPGDSRFRYMLANELKNEGRLDDAIAQYREILARDPDYGPAYYHGGQTLEKLDRLDEARELYAAGIAATTRTGDAHTRGELEAALMILG